MEKHPLQLIVGLANPGPQYSHTRHNAGAWFVEALAAAENLSLSVKPKFYARYAKMTGQQGDVHLLIPETFMNLSGKAVAAIVQFYKIPPTAILIVHDELDLPSGALKLKQGGGNAGHNGLKDIQAKIGSGDFWRLRIGIGHPGVREQVTSYVLGIPQAAEQQTYQAAISKALTEFPELIMGNMQKFMQSLH